MTLTSLSNSDLHAAKLSLLNGFDVCQFFRRNFFGLVRDAFLQGVFTAFGIRRTNRARISPT
jgi:hypothetical protein|tara:strand:- start:290 stop:475 length:186 start_codon:yes stop_codon:yes gene_type:complete